MRRIEILLTDVMRTRIYLGQRTGDYYTPRFLLDSLKRDLKMANKGNYNYFSCPSNISAISEGCPNDCQACWNKAIDNFEKEEESPCL